MAEVIERVGVLASGDHITGEGGSTVARFTRDILEGKVNLELGVVICNNPEGSVGVYPKIAALNKEFNLRGDDRIDVVEINNRTHPGTVGRNGEITPEASVAICRLLEQRGVGFAAMLGYMKIITGEFLDTWGWKPEYGVSDTNHNGIYHPDATLWNNHNGILLFTAGFHGPDTHREAYRLFHAGTITHTAISFQLATAKVDAGPVIGEKLVPIYSYQTPDEIGNCVQAAEQECTAFAMEDHLIHRRAHLLGNS